MTADESSLYRILDANHNRVAEGLRVIEEYLRFVLQDRHLSGRVKDLRHELQQAMQAAAGEKAIVSRDTLGDVGQEMKATDEHARQSLRDLVGANWQRVQQGLRVLEEYAKLLPGETSLAIERLRYQAYTLAKATIVTRDSRERLADAALYVLVPTLVDDATFGQLVRELVAAEVDVLQLRDKEANDRTLLSRARLLREVTRGSKTLFIMNDRPDIALLSVADGVHVGQDELSVADARRIIGPEKLIGVSTHNLDQAIAAVLAGANYLGCGPTFPSQTKDFNAFAGLDFLRAVAAEISLPAFAIGGIDESNLPAVLNTGFRRIAVSAAVVQAKTPAQAAKTLKALLGK